MRKSLWRVRPCGVRLPTQLLLVLCTRLYALRLDEELYAVFQSDVQWEG